MNKYYITDGLYGKLCNTLDDFEHSTDNPNDKDYLSDGEWLDEFVDLTKTIKRKVSKQLTGSVEVADLATRFFNYLDPWDRDYRSADEIAQDIENDPCLVIEYLLDLLEG